MSDDGWNKSAAEESCREGKKIFESLARRKSRRWLAEETAEL